MGLSPHVDGPEEDDRRSTGENEDLVDFPPTIMRIGEAVGLTLVVTVWVLGVEVRAVVDTAAQISMISMSLLHQLGIHPTVCSHELIKIKNAENYSFMSCFLIPELPFRMCGRRYRHTLAAGPITDKLILGIDFWVPQQGVIDLALQHIRMKEATVPIKMLKMEGGEWHNVSQVSVAEDQKLPARSQSLVKVRLSNKSQTDFVTAPFFITKALGPAGVIRGGQVSWMEITNDSGEEIELKADTFLTTASEITNILEVAEVDQLTLQVRSLQPGLGGVDAADVECLPDHLKDLYGRSISLLSKTQRQKVANLLVEYQGVFASSDEDLGKFDLISHKVPTTDEGPVQDRMRRTPLKFVGEEETALKKMLDGGIIQPSTSSWSSAPVLVRKKDGSVRYAIDYRKLNAKTIKDAYPLPLIAECIDALQGSMWFHALDLASGYWQVALDAEDAHKTAFITKYGLFEYTRMPFGLCNAPATFQRVMHLVLRGMLWKQVLVYLDDVVILGSSFEEAWVNLENTLKRFQEHNLKLKPRKCHLFQEEIKFLGRKVSKQSIQISDEHTECIREWRTPRNLDELLKFLGFINYHREFIPRLAEKANPLFALTKKGCVFKWSAECEASFQQLKGDVMSSSFLSLPTDGDPFLLDTDASDFAVAGCLYQVRDGVEYPISFASQSLTGTQRKYCTTRKELLAIVVFTRRFRHYLLGSQVTVRTDHGSLAWLYRFKEPSGQLGRWLEELSQYDMRIIHRPGRLHTNADALSRLPQEDNACNCYEAGSNLESLPCGGCRYCSRLHHQWARFHEDVDYIVPLAVRTVQAEVDNPGEEGVNLTGYNAKQLRDLQEQDPALKPLINWLEGGNPSEGEVMLQGAETKRWWRHKDQLKLIDGALYYQWLEPLGQVVDKLVVPESLRTEVMQMAHDGVIGGHWGTRKTMDRVRKRLHWHALARDIIDFIATCASCNKNKNHRKNRAALTSYQAGVPNERVHLDFLGPFMTSRRGNKYILSMVDQFTKWIEVCPLPEQTAAATARAFFEGWIARFGVPMQLHTDQGGNFTSGLFTELCRIMQATKTRTTPYRPSSNGQVERYNQMILSYVRCQLAGDDQQWDEHLPALGLSLRSTVNRNTGFTPNMLQLGREVNLPMDILFGVGRPPARPPFSYVEELEERMKEIFRNTRQTLQAAQVRQKLDYDTRAAVREQAFGVGDLIYLLNNATKVGHSAKLQPIMTGPYVVSAKPSANLYAVRGKRRTSMVHQDQMRLCEDRCVPWWVHRVRRQVLNGEPPERSLDEDVDLHRFFEMSCVDRPGDTISTGQRVVELTMAGRHTLDTREDAPLPSTMRGRPVRKPQRYLE